MKLSALLARSAFLCAAALLLTNCSGPRAQQRVARDTALASLPSALTKGQTLQAEVLDRVGPPDQREPIPEGEIWRYGQHPATSRYDSRPALGGSVGFGSGAGFGGSFGIATGVRIGTPSNSNRRPFATLIWDTSGRLKDYAVTVAR